MGTCAKIEGMSIGRKAENNGLCEPPKWARPSSRAQLSGASRGLAEIKFSVACPPLPRHIMSKGHPRASKYRSAAQRQLSSKLGSSKKVTTPKSSDSDSALEPLPANSQTVKGYNTLQRIWKNAEQREGYTKQNLAHKKQAWKVAQETVDQLSTQVMALEQTNKSLSQQNSANMTSVSHLAQSVSALKRKFELVQEQRTEQEAKIGDLLEDLKASKAENNNLCAKKRKLDQQC